ncbi:MAG: hypothetical protein JWL59_2073 [Chthoniobacteraceae bacterium]|nr:hypothetical protein [Chthoniobacteraceae bacterium]
MDSIETARADRAVRLFVSSTFSDMLMERRVLVERVFPQVREWCHARGVSFTEIDLRWGITEEQSRGGRVLPICLGEIEACHPFFLGLIGGRYGSLAKRFTPELLTDYPWLRGMEQRSYTELEFARALWTESGPGISSLVYERDPAFDSYSESPGSEPAKQLAEFKARVRNAGLMARADCYRGAEELGSWVLEDLIHKIELLFPESVPPSPEEREREIQSRVRRLRGRRFIGSREILKRLDAHVLGGANPLLICAPSGAGKSTTLAAWAALAEGEFEPSLYLTKAWKDRFPKWWRGEAAVASPVTGQLAALVFCAVAASPQTSSWPGVVRFVCEEMRRRFSLILPSLPDDPAALSALFADFLLAVAARGRVAIVLDGIDRLPGDEADRAVASIPTRLPASLRLFISAAPGRIANQLRALGGSELRLPNWSEEERRLCLQAFRDDFRKELSHEGEERLISAPQTAQPLFLCTSLEELRVVSSHSDVAERITAQLAAADVTSLFEQMFARFEHSFEEERPYLVCECLSLLWAARRGLRESELREMVGLDGEPLAASIWAPLAAALRPHLAQRDGLLAFDTAALPEAVQRCYLASREDRFAVHGMLADYFQPQLPDSRALAELAWQLLWAARIDELATLLTDPKFLPAAWRWDREELLNLIGELKTGGIQIAKIFSSEFKILSSNIEASNSAANLLFALGETEAATLFAEAALSHAEASQDVVRADELGTMLALLDQRRGCLLAAEARLSALVSHARVRNDLPRLALQLGNRGTVLRELGRTHEAYKCFAEEESVCRELGDRRSHVGAIGHLGQIEFDNGQVAEALARFDTQIICCRQLGDARQLQSALGNAAACHAALNRIEKAMALHAEEEELCRQRGDRHALQVCLGNQARLLQRFRAADYDRAMKLLEERERLVKELGDPAAEAATLLQFSRLYYALSATQFGAAVEDYAQRAAALANQHGLGQLAHEIKRWQDALRGS